LLNDASRGVASAIVLAATLVSISILTTCPACRARESEVRGSLWSTDLLNTDLGATVLDARLDAEVEFGHFTLGGAYRGYHLSDKRYNPRGIEGPQPVMKHRYAEMRFEKLGNAGSVFARAGHFFATWDRGLTLRSFEDIDLEKDTALDGILGECAIGNLKVTGLSGKMTERINDIQYNEHSVSGGRIAVSREGLFSFAASGLVRQTERHDRQRDLPANLRQFDDTVLGSEAELWLSALHLAGDYTYREGDYYLGHGLYLSGTLSSRWLTVLSEYKDYRRFANPLVNPPTCVREHVWILMNRATHQVDLTDERGYLVEGTLTAFDKMPIIGSASEARKHNGDLAHWEMFGQVDRAISGSVNASLGGSWSREYAAGGLTEYKTGMVETEITPESGRGIELGFGVQKEQAHPEEPYGNYLVSGTFYPHEAVTLSAVAEATTQKGLKRDRWAFGEVRVNMGEGLDASVGFGTERGGKKCSGGVCYTEPEFAGVRLTFSKSF
jgi:hypothetical protein